MVRWATASSQALAAMGEDVLARRWRWFLGLGLVLAAAGVFALGAAATREPIVLPTIGWTLLAAGTLQAMHGVWRRQWGGFLVELITGLLYAVMGLAVVTDPYRSTAALSLVLAVSLVTSGGFRIVVAALARFPHRGWLLLHGAASVGLGVGLWAGWPFVGPWVLGLFVGAELLAAGLVLAMLGLAARKLSPEPTRDREPPLGAEPHPLG